MSKVRVSIIIRTLNEAKYLPECINKINFQDCDYEFEIIVVDSGSDDGTIDLAEQLGANILFIDKDNFTFGRSLNIGCEAANGDVLVFLSAHCIPLGNSWLRDLCEPIFSGAAPYAFGRQVIRDGISSVAEGQVFTHYYPESNSAPRLPFFVNNANAALNKKTWENFKFNETLTGLEDMALGKLLVDRGQCICYVPHAIVEHIHDENWMRIKNRYEREAVALQTIDESLTLNFLEAIYCFINATSKDLMRNFAGVPGNFFDILRYRSAQFYGGYSGGKLSRKKVNERKNIYFYPR